MGAGNGRRGAVAASRRHLSYANVMATIAVFVAVATGGAYAASQIGPKDIAKNAVRAKHVKKQQIKAKHVKRNAVRTKHLRDGTVSEVKLADGVAVSGPKGDKGDEGDKGEQGAQGPEGPATGAAGGDLTGSYPNPALAAGAVNETNLAPALEARIAALESDVAALQALLAGVTRETVAGNDTLLLSGMNMQLVNGTGSTDGPPNALGNLIIGYNAVRAGATRAGSHYLVVGDSHEWTRFGGILAGLFHTASGNWASVLGGSDSTASGNFASVSGGLANTASGDRASVSGGFFNTASGVQASVSGGEGNTAGGDKSSASGGINNSAAGIGSSILGGNAATTNNTDECHPAC